MADKDNSARIEDFLKQVRWLKEQHEKCAAVTGEDFNIFSVLGVETREVKTHSAFLAELLNPKGSHRQGVVFLEHFLNLECLRPSAPSDYGNLEDFWVRAEVSNEYGQIDILLKKEGTCIIIENKINASDQDSQLNRYYRYAKESFTDEQIKLIYLTLCGREPSKKSLRGIDGQEALDVDRVIRISYKSHIVKWIEECFKEVIRVAPIREILFQYQTLIKKLTSQPMNKELTMKISCILARDYYDLLTELENSVPEAKTRIGCNFWEKLKKKIESYGLERFRSNANQLNEVSKDNIYNNRSGITFKVCECNLDPTFKIVLRVELRTDNNNDFQVFYGFVLLEDDSRVDHRDKKRFGRYANLVSDELETSWSEWLGVKVLKDVSFSDFGTEQMRYIAEDAELEKLVETIAQEIKDAVDKFIKAKEDAGL